MGDVEAFAGGDAPFSFPVICDSDRSLAVRLGMLDPSDVGQAGLAMPVRAVFIVGPDKLLKLSILCEWCSCCCRFFLFFFEAGTDLFFVC